MYQRNHAKAGGAQPILAVVVCQPGVENEQWLVPVKYPAQVPYHFFLGGLLVN